MATLTEVWEAIAARFTTQLGLQVVPVAEPNLEPPYVVLPILPEGPVQFRGTFGNGVYGRLTYRPMVVLGIPILSETAKTALAYADPTGQRSVFAAFAPATAGAQQTLNDVVSGCTVMDVADEGGVEIGEQLVGWGVSFGLEVVATRST